MDGAASDLRTGLPWQMVEIHEPVRLCSSSRRRPRRCSRIMDRNPGIGRLCRNGWVQLAVLDPDSRDDPACSEDGEFHAYQPQADGPAAGGVLGRLVSRLARPPGVRRDRALTPGRHTGARSSMMLDYDQIITVLGVVVVAAPLLLTDRPRARRRCWAGSSPSETTTQAGPGGDRRRPAGGRRRPGARCWSAGRGTCDRAGRTGSSSRTLPLLGQVRLRPAVGAVRDPVVRAVRARSAPSPAATCTASAGYNRFFVLYAAVRRSAWC